MKSLKELNKKYDLELEKIISKINNLKVTRKQKSKLVLLQFPDGLKPYATAVVDYLEKELAPLGVPSSTEFEVKFLIYMESCFGACDIPVLPEELKKKIDLVVQFGHNDLMPEF